MKISSAIALAFVLPLAAACSSSDSGSSSNDQDSSVPPSDSSSDGSGTDTSRTDTLGDTSTSDTGVKPDSPSDGTPSGAIKTVFIIMEENHDWSAIQGNSSAPYINGTLLPMGGYAKNYKTPPGIHPSEPNYIWLEAGDNLGITTDDNPSKTHQSTTDHLVTQLETKGLDWRSYQEDIDGKTCPLTSVGNYAPKHNPMVYFDDVTETNKTTAARCIAHVRPFTELATDIAAGKVAPYNFITPNLCNDMHGGTGCASDLVKAADDWLGSTVPTILGSAAYKAGGALFVIWDEGSGGSDGPIGMIVISPFAKKGYSNSTAYTHSSTLKTVEEVLGVPLLRGAADAKTTDLGDFFTSFP